MEHQADVIIVGTGVAGLFCALQLPKELHILMITKDKAEHSDSYLAQGGISTLRTPEDTTAILKIPCVQVIIKTIRTLLML